MYKAWFPKGEDDPEIAVMRIDVSEGDYREASGSKLVMLVIARRSLHDGRQGGGGGGGARHCISDLINSKVCPIHAAV